MHRRLVGKLLVSPPWMKDPNFDRTVVLLLAHTEDGAFGIVLNRESDLRADEVADRWEHLVSRPALVFRGGPCEVQHVIALGDTDSAAVNVGETTEVPDWTILFNRVGTVDLSRSPIDFFGVSRVRLFAGYSGWGPMQLEAEIDSESWYVLDSDADDIFIDAPDELWGQVLRRNGRDLAAVSMYPPDPSLN
jgi:putative transcriptional regulator